MKNTAKNTISLPKEIKDNIVKILAEQGEVTITGLVYFKLGTVTMKGRELKDKNPKKGFRITDINKTYKRIDSTVLTQFKRVVNRQVM